jgi:hypothetical protein
MAVLNAICDQVVGGVSSREVHAKRDTIPAIEAELTGTIGVQVTNQLESAWGDEYTSDSRSVLVVSL